MSEQRTEAIVVRVSKEEREMARKLTEVMDDPISRVLRRHLRQLYRERFGDERPNAKGASK